MSCGCLLFVHLRCHQWEDCDLVFLHTLTASGKKERTRENTTELSLLIREQNEYIRGGTQTVLQYPSLHHQRRNSGIIAVMFRRSDCTARGSTDWYEGLHITLYGVWTPPVQGGDGTTEYEEKTLVQSMKVLTEINLRTLQDKTFLAWDTAYKSEHSQSWDTACKSEHSHHRTLQIMGHLVSVHSIYSVLLNSFSMILLSFVF